jgi:membrane protein YqaA with SNARE-associated domain
MTHQALDAASPMRYALRANASSKKRDLKRLLVGLAISPKRNGGSFMISWISLNPGGIYISCFILSFLSALFPWINGEGVLLACAVATHSPGQLFFLVLLTSSGQMAGKCLLYWVARGVIPLRSFRQSASVTAWRDRLAQSASKPSALAFISSTLGVPPFYILTIIFGILKMRFLPFFCAGSIGRLVRFGLVATLPGIAFHFFK